MTAPTSQTDARGETRRFSFRGQEFSLVFTKAGYLRGGDFHSSTQYILLLSGEFELTTREDGQDKVTKKSANELLAIPAQIPHMLKALTDGVFIEWLEGPMDMSYYRPYRDLVEMQIKNSE